MTDRLAVVLGVLIVAAIMLDIVLFGSQNLLFLGKKFYWMIEYLAFWR
ncbi:MAG: hypothetical protein N4A70_16145 [Pelagimonas sp.]|jgi:hypothetical protein|nr:hypothetical protein [Pelagimonas sp.]